MDYRAIDRQLASPVQMDLDERAAPRFTLLMRTAKLVAGDAEYLCVIRDVSSAGVSVRLFHPLPPVSRMTLEMQTGDCHGMYPVWQREGEAGFRFCTPVDVEKMVRNSSRYPKRELRFSAEMPVGLCIDGCRHETILRNISQQGAMVECDRHMALGQAVRVESDQFPEIVARVRWRMGNRYGLVFDTTFRMLELARLVVSLNRTAPDTINSPAPSSLRSAT